jgi:hypothetical protein
MSRVTSRESRVTGRGMVGTCSSLERPNEGIQHPAEILTVIVQELPCTSIEVANIAGQ